MEVGIIMYVLMLGGQWTTHHDPKVTDMPSCWSRGNELVNMQPTVKTFVCVDRRPDGVWTAQPQPGSVRLIEQED